MRIVKLTESDLEKIVKKVLTEQSSNNINPKGLKMGDGGKFNPKQAEDVRQLQQKLSDLGLLKLRQGPTGYFGEYTQRALAKAEGKPLPSITPKTAGQSKTQTQTSPVKGNVQGNVGQSKVTTKDPSIINSYPSCVRYSKPSNDAGILGTIGNMFGGNYGDWFIGGKGFYEGYTFFNNGTYVSIGNKKKGTYSCNEKNKVILDIAAKASNPNTKKSGNYKFSPRIDAEIQHIKNRKMDNTPFFIYDPKENLIYLFNTGGVYVASSSVVDGADAQKSLSDAKAFTHDDWCKVSGMDASPFLCTDPQTKKQKDAYYGALTAISARFLPKGIYTIKGLSYHEGYTGGSKGGYKNSFSLKPIKLEGTITAAAKKNISAAIHGIPGLPERLKASKNLESVLQSDVNGGKVPAKYLDNINAILAANQSFGCVGVPASFINNPKIQSIVSANLNEIKVFALGEDSQDFLVKNDKQQPGDDQSSVA